MNWTDVTFALLVGAAWLVYRLLPARRRGHWLTLVSVAVFALEGAAALGVVAAMVVWTSRWGVRIHRTSAKRRCVGAGVAGLLVMLAAGKYGNWLLGLAGLPALAGVHAPSWLGPLGMSYFVFRMISYLVDVAQGKHEPGNAWAIAGYALFFPTLPAGPIERYEAFAPQVAAGAGPTLEDLRAGALRIAAGLFKKVVLTDFLLEWAKLMRESQTYGAGWMWVALYAYTLYIYVDFSGYSDMAVGVARLFGIRIRENFNWPYLRTNIAEFWRHWHMSLTAFITEYIYYPLGGNRKGLTRAGVNTLIAMGLCGMWHGAGWHFIAWGLYHGAGLTVYRVWRKLRETYGWHRPKSKARKALAWAVTFHFVALGWALFYMSLGEALRLYLALLGLGG